MPPSARLSSHNKVCAPTAWVEKVWQDDILKVRNKLTFIVISTLNSPLSTLMIIRHSSFVIRHWLNLRNKLTFIVISTLNSPLSTLMIIRHSSFKKIRVETKDFPSNYLHSQLSTLHSKFIIHQRWYVAKKGYRDNSP